MSVVFIPTKERQHMLEKVLPKWQEQRKIEGIILVVEPQEWRQMHNFAHTFAGVHVMKLPHNDRGVNYARRQIVYQARADDLERIIMSDDDIYPKADCDVNLLVEDLSSVDSLGLGIMMSFYGLMFGNDTISQAKEPMLSINSLGKRLFSLDIERVMSAGNFDERFHSGWGDDELVRQGMASLGMGWWVHPRVRGVSIAGRYEHGGLNALHGERAAARVRGQEECHRISYEKWGGEYINKPAPGKRLVCRWRRMLDAFVPEWQKLATWRNK